MRIFILSGLIFSLHTALAQKNEQIVASATDSLIWKNNKNYAIMDSTGKPINEFQFFCAVYLPKDSLKIKTRLYKPSRVKVSFNYNRNHSFGLNPDNEDLAFKYNQTIINIYQLYTNKLRRALYEIRFKPGYYGLFDNTFKEVYNELQLMNESFKTQTENGRREDKINEWQRLLLSELEKFENKK